MRPERDDLAERVYARIGSPRDGHFDRGFEQSRERAFERSRDRSLIRKILRAAEIRPVVLDDETVR